MSTKIDYSIRVTCDCGTCKINAKHLGKAFPLVAYTTAEEAANLKITSKNANTARKVHSVVYLANHPMLGRAQRAYIAG